MKINVTFYRWNVSCAMQQTIKYRSYLRDVSCYTYFLKAHVSPIKLTCLPQNSISLRCLNMVIHLNPCHFFFLVKIRFILSVSANKIRKLPYSCKRSMGIIISDLQIYQVNATRLTSPSAYIYSISDSQVCHIRLTSLQHEFHTRLTYLPHKLTSLQHQSHIRLTSISI